MSKGGRGGEGSEEAQRKVLEDLFLLSPAAIAATTAARHAHVNVQPPGPVARAVSRSLPTLAYWHVHRSLRSVWTPEVACRSEVRGR